MIKTHTELTRLKTFEERFEYLKLHGSVGRDTFGFDRVFNQKFYTSSEWRTLRNHIIVRDNCCDLGVEDYDILGGKIIIHHLNPINLKDIQDATEYLMNPEYLITTTHATHQAIHYGDRNLLHREPVVRTKYDTCPWKR